VATEQSATPRWFTAHGPGHAQWYIDRFRRMADEGADLLGEVRFLDALLPRHAHVLDAGCGPGRHAAALHDLGHAVVGVDVDPELIAAAAAAHPGPRWIVGDLATLDLADEAPFDAALLAGNVLVFVAPGSERRVIERVAAHVRPDGVIVTGFNLGHDYQLSGLDADAAAAGLVLEHRFATWDLRPQRDDAEWAVSVFRKPQGS